MSAGIFNSISAPEWTGHLTRVVDLGTLSDDPETVLYDPPLRYIKANAAGDVTFTLHSDDTADAAKKVTYTFAAGQELGVFAIRKIWATGTTVAVGNLLGAR